MGCTMREKHIRANRRPRSVKPDSDSCDKDAISKSIAESGLKPFKYHLGPNDSSQNANSNPNPNPNVEETGWGYCTEEQLEEILLKNLEFIYNEAVSKLVALGYDEDVAMKAILRNGHCYGGMDVLTNILHNSIAFLNSNGDGGGGCNNGGNLDESEPVFSDLRQLEEYSLAGMVCLLQQVRPHLSKGDAMWCLLMSDLHVGRASSMEIPVPGNGCPAATAPATVEAGGNSVGVMAPALCRFHGGWGFGDGGGLDFPVNGIFSCGAEMNLQLQRDIEFPKRFNLSPSMKSLLKRNVAMFAAGFRANSKQLQTHAKAFPGRSSASNVDSLAVSGAEVHAEQSGDSQNLDNQDAVNSVLSKFRDLNLDENLELVAEDQKDELIVNLFHQIKDLEKQVKERKDWAHQKAMQAARKLSSDLTELKMLRMEREETQKLKKGKQALEDTTMKRLSEMENALRKASGQVDRANAAVRRLETENAEIKAEMEASKLSASESVTACLEVAKREKKCLKKLLAWEKQKAKLQQEISDEKEKILETQEILVQIRQAQKDAEVKWKEELKAKEEALALVEEERRSKEAAESNNKRKLEALRLKIEIDFQRHKDDLLRLEQELSRLKASAQSAELHHQSNTSPISDLEGAKPKRETIARLLQELDNLEDFSEKEVNRHRECIICMKDEVSIVFLPCAHQVMCASCSDEYGRKGKAVCPCCRVQIQQRIRVFGASS
ncbi:MND1-interacting protein 1 [Abrus precatorius]|uniref:MND1-interacting protein 1 n=1 Tax=Abrus precatorius TaxID=3816 RepID=A0A8B8KSB7_ABRPR|nr:MND1-interacting protein 1 [Abrus precatorius]XP_027346763.1 MND1-interacting protein 1 [Abrus precatorius]